MVWITLWKMRNIPPNWGRVSDIKTKFYYRLLVQNIVNKIYQKSGKFESLNEHKILLRHLFKKDLKKTKNRLKNLIVLFLHGALTTRYQNKFNFCGFYTQISPHIPDFKIMVLSHLGQNMFTLTAAPQCSHRFLSCRKSTMIRINLSNRVAGNFFLRKRVINTSIKMICAEVFLSPFFFTEKILLK